MLSFCSLCYLVIPVIGYIGYNWFQKYRAQKVLERWSKTPKDVVILHGVARAKTTPSASPFVLKLETFLRMAKIKYEFDGKDSFGPKGKSPWITLNGEHYSDSQLIIEFLQKKFEVNLDKDFSDEQLSMATVVRVALEEHAFWGCILWTFVFDSARHINDVINVPKWLIPLFIGRSVKNTTYAHGIGRHTPDEIERMTKKDLKSVSKLLGNKKFICGNEPCTDDAAIFGLLAQTQWGQLMKSPYQKFINEELTNLKEYCIRMRELYWQDWDKHCEP